MKTCTRCKKEKELTEYSLSLLVIRNNMNRAQIAIVSLVLCLVVGGVFFGATGAMVGLFLWVVTLAFLSVS